MKKLCLALALLLNLLLTQFAHAESSDMRLPTMSSALASVRALEALRQNHSDLLGGAQGILVIGVVIGSQADAAGIRVGDDTKGELGDIVVSYAGQPIDTGESFVSAVTRLASTDGNVDMVVIRANTRVVVKLKSGRVGILFRNVATLDGTSAAGSALGQLDEKPHVFAQLGQLAGPFQFSPLAVSPDGRRALSGSGNEVRLWDLASGREIRTLSGHKDKVTSVAFSPNGHYALSGSFDGVWRLWELSSGKMIHAHRGHADWGVSVAFSPDGRMALTGAGDMTLQLWDLASGLHVRTLVDPLGQSAPGVAAMKGRLAYVAFSPDGRQALTAATYYTGQQMHPSLKLWDVATGKVLRSMDGHSAHIYSISFSPDGRRALSGGEDKEIKLWDLASGEEIRTLKGHSSNVNTVAFSKDGKLAFSAGALDGVKVWDLASGRVIREFDSIVDRAAFSPDGRQALTVNMEAMRLWDTATGTQMRRFLGNSGGFYEPAAFSPDGGRVVMAGAASTGIWDFATGSKKVAITGGSAAGAAYDGAMSLAFSPDGGKILTGHDDKSLRLRDANTGKLIRSFQGHSDLVSSVALSRDGRKALSLSLSGLTGNIRLWDVDTGEIIRTMTVPGDAWVKSVALSPDGKQALSAAATGSEAEAVILWDLASGRPIRTFAGFSGAAVFSPDGRSALSGSYDGAGEFFLRLFDIGTGLELRRFKGHSNLIQAVAFSPDGKLALSGSLDNSMKLWDVAAGKEIRTFAGHASEVSSVSFSPDGRLALSGSVDSSAVIWEVASGKQIVQLNSFNDGEWISITPDGYYNASPNGDKYLNVRVGNQVYGIENYRETFFRPDLVKALIAGGSLAGYRNIADIKTPPQVDIVSTPLAVAGDELTVQLRLSDTGGGIGDVRLYLNGSAVMTDNGRGLKLVAVEKQPGSTRSYKIRLSRGENIIRAVAFNADNSMQSNPAEQTVTATFTPSAKPNLHALVIGINEFKNPKLRLQYAVPDADLFAETLTKGAAGLFGAVNVVRLTTPEQTSSANITSELKKMRSINPDDMFILFIASHGTVDDGEYFLITSNVGSTSTAKLKTDALSQNSIKELIANIPATKKVIMLDTCNAGQMGDAIQVALMTRGMSEDTAFKILSRAVGSTILSSATSTQEALEGYRGHGLFTWVLAEGMRGKADKGKSGYIKTTDLVDYVESEVPEIAETHFRRKQYPTTAVSGQGFPIGKNGL